MDIEPQNELLLQMTNIMTGSGEKGRVHENVKKKEFCCNSFSQVLKKLEIVLDVLEK
jgi:hypothetical protein